MSGLIVNPYRFGSTKTLKALLTSLELTDDLVLCLDAADLDSYPGSGQTWFDVSGQGNHFFRGATGSSSTDDPTFNGTAGQQDDGTYWTFDGGDFFQEADAGMNFAADWASTGAAFSIFAMVYLTQGNSTPRGIFTTADTFLGFDENEKIRTFFNNDIELDSDASSNSYSNNEWAFCAIAIDEAGGAGASFIRLNTTVTTFNGNVTGDNPVDGPYKVGGATSFVGGSPLIANTRMSMIAAWNRKLSTTEIGDLYTAIKAIRHPTLA